MSLRVYLAIEAIYSFSICYLKLLLVQSDADWQYAR